MHYDVSYKGDNSPHRALNDLCQWLGFRRSRLVFREAKRIAKIENETDRNMQYDFLCCSIEMCGVVGEPVRRLFARFGGEEQLQSWIGS